MLLAATDRHRAPEHQPVFLPHKYATNPLSPEPLCSSDRLSGRHDLHRAAIPYPCSYTARPCFCKPSPNRAFRSRKERNILNKSLIWPRPTRRYRGAVNSFSGLHTKELPRMHAQPNPAPRRPSHPPAKQSAQQKLCTYEHPGDRSPGQPEQSPSMAKRLDLGQKPGLIAVEYRALSSTSLPQYLWQSDDMPAVYGQCGHRVVRLPAALSLQYMPEGLQSVIRAKPRSTCHDECASNRILGGFAKKSKPKSCMCPIQTSASKPPQSKPQAPNPPTTIPSLPRPPMPGPYQNHKYTTTAGTKSHEANPPITCPE